jgi:hypothetical protein
MDQIIQAISAKLNLPESTVRSGLGIILNFVKQKAAGTQFEQFLAAVPGSAAIMSGAPAADGGGLLGGLLGKAGGLLGGDLAGAAGALGALQQAGIPMDKAGPLASEFFEQAKTVAGPDVVSSLLQQLPALQALLGSKK